MSAPLGPAPMLSFAVPVRNGERHLPRLLASLRAQDFDSFEVVVSDNASTDSTPELLRAAAAQDPRIRVVRWDENLGQIANFNRALELARGRYVRWIGCDDWLDPRYARTCVEALEAAPHAVGVTTYQDHVEDDGTRHYVEYTGPRLESDDPATRYRRMLWFMTADYRFIDPLYSVLRRSVLLQTRRLQVIPSMDQVLALELALAGPFIHVPQCLAHRGKETATPEELARRYHPSGRTSLDQRLILTRTLPAMWSPLLHVALSPRERIACAAALARFGLIAGHYVYAPRLRGRARVALERIAPGAVAAFKARRSEEGTHESRNPRRRTRKPLIRRDRSEAQAHGGDRGSTDPVAHHEDLRASGVSGLRNRPWVQE